MNRRWYDQGRAGGASGRRARLGGIVGSGMDILDVPMYVPADAARMIGVQPQRVRRWLRESKAAHARPVVRRAGSAETPYASFLDLMDLLFVKQFLDEGVSLPRLRRALDEARTILGSDHFAYEHFWTNGKGIYLKVRDRSDALLAANALKHHQRQQHQPERTKAFRPGRNQDQQDQDAVGQQREQLGAPGNADITSPLGHDLYFAFGSGSPFFAARCPAARHDSSAS